jgi:hypothetical protein
MKSYAGRTLGRLPPNWRPEVMRQVLLAVCVLVLLIARANVANQLLARRALQVLQAAVSVDLVAGATLTAARPGRGIRAVVKTG